MCETLAKTHLQCFLTCTFFTLLSTHYFYQFNLLEHSTHSLPFFLSDLFALYPADHGGWLSRGWHYVTVKPWVGYIMIMGFTHFTWVYLLLMTQIFQVERKAGERVFLDMSSLLCRILSHHELLSLSL